MTPSPEREPQHIPAWVDKARLCQETCLGADQLTDLVAKGVLPAPRQIGDDLRWKWSEVKHSMNGRVYFLECLDLIKIGFSRSLKNRMKTLQNSLPCSSTLLHVAIGSERTEKYLHERFAELRVRGEWFRRERLLTDFIENLKGGGSI